MLVKSFNKKQFRDLIAIGLHEEANELITNFEASIGGILGFKHSKFYDIEEYFRIFGFEYYKVEKLRNDLKVNSSMKLGFLVIGGIGILAFSMLLLFSIYSDKLTASDTTNYWIFLIISAIVFLFGWISKKQLLLRITPKSITLNMEDGQKDIPWKDIYRISISRGANSRPLIIYTNEGDCYNMVLEHSDIHFKTMVLYIYLRYTAFHRNYDEKHRLNVNWKNINLDVRKPRT